MSNLYGICQPLHAGQLVAWPWTPIVEHRITLDGISADPLAVSGRYWPMSFLTIGDCDGILIDQELDPEAQNAAIRLLLVRPTRALQNSQDARAFQAEVAQRFVRWARTDELAWD